MSGRFRWRIVYIYTVHTLILDKYYSHFGKHQRGIHHMTPPNPRGASTSGCAEGEVSPPTIYMSTEYDIHTSHMSTAIEIIHYWSRSGLIVDLPREYSFGCGVSWRIRSSLRDIYQGRRSRGETQRAKVGTLACRGWISLLVYCCRRVNLAVRLMLWA